MAPSKEDRLLKTFRSMIIQEADSLEEARVLADRISYRLKVGGSTRWPPVGHIGNPDMAILPGKVVSFYRQQQAIVANACARARNLGLPATLTLEQWLLVLDHFDRRCAYCRERPYECLEHFISLMVNSEDGTTITNCVPSCRKCNARKTRAILPTAQLEAVYSYLQTVHELYPSVHIHRQNP